MAATTLVRDFFASISINLKDTDPQYERWYMVEIAAWTNDGLRAICKYMPHAFAVVTAIKLEAGARQGIKVVPAARNKDGVQRNGVLVQDVYANLGATGDSQGRAITMVDRGVMDRAAPNWRTAGSSPIVREWMYDQQTPGFFWVSPPNDGTGWVEASLVWEPTPIPTAGKSYLTSGPEMDIVPCDDLYIDDLRNYALARCYLKDAEAESSKELFAAHTQLFTSSINAQVKAVTGVNPNLKSIPFTPAVPASSN